MLRTRSLTYELRIANSNVFWADDSGKIQKQHKFPKERVEPRTFHLLVRLCFGMVAPGNDNGDADDDDIVDDDDDDEDDYDDVMILWLAMVVTGFSLFN